MPATAGTGLVESKKWDRTENTARSFLHMPAFVGKFAKSCFGQSERGHGIPDLGQAALQAFHRQVGLLQGIIGPMAAT